MSMPRRRKLESSENDPPAQRACRRPAGAHDDGGHDSPVADGGDGNHIGLRTGNRTLACHYYKFFPTQFTRCLLRNHITSTSFALQHLARCHMKPTCIQCPTCKQSFDKAKECDRHVKQQTCRREASPIGGDLDNNILEGIDAGQLALLRSRPKRGLTEAERWYAIWDVLFPYSPRPDSPYIISPEDEILRIARRAMKMVSPYGTSLQFLDRLDWSTVSSVLENQSSNQAADQPFNKTASLSPVDFPIFPQSGDAEPSSTTVIPSVSNQAESLHFQSSSDFVPAWHMETPTCSAFPNSNESTVPNTPPEEQLFTAMPPWEAGYVTRHDVLSDGFQMQGESVEPMGWFFNGASDDVFPWGTSDYEFVNTGLIPEIADPSTTAAPPVPPPAVDTSTLLPFQIPLTSLGSTLQNSLEDDGVGGEPLDMLRMILTDEQNINTREGLADGSLWDEAPDALDSEEPEHIATDENISLTCEALAGAQKQTPTALAEGKDIGTARNHIPQDQAARREELRKVTELGLELMQQKEIRTTLLGHVIVRQDVEPDIAAAVEWAEDHINGDIKDLPYLPIIMAGVSLSPSLLKKPLKGKFADQDDFPYVTPRMPYTATESLVPPEDMRADQKAGGTDRPVMESYDWKLVFRFQVQSLIWFCHSQAKALSSSFIGYDSWEKKLQSIKEGDKAFVSKVRVATFGTDFQGLKQVARDAECLQQTLDNLLGRVEELVGVSQNDLGTIQSAASRACLEALQPSNHYGEKDRTGSEKGVLFKDGPSCWVLGRDDFERSRGDTDGQLLWIHGNPDKGKTMLLCGIIDELNIVAPKDISLFFCQATDARINNAATVLRGLIYMLVTQQPALASHLRKGCNGFGKRRLESPDPWVALSEVLTSILEDPGLRRTYFVLDALDEYTKDLHLLLSLVAQNSSASLSAKWIMPSHNWPSIEKDLDTAIREAGLSLEHKEKSVSAAIAAYVEFKAGKLEKQTKYSDDTRDAVEHCLFANAHDIFLSVVLVGRDLATTSGWKMKKILTSFPIGLDALYNQTLGQICTCKDAALYKDGIFTIVSVVYQPTVLDDELTAFVDTLDGTSGHCKVLTGLCGSLLTLREPTISSVRQPSKDFLVKQARDWIFPTGIEEIRCRVCSSLLRVMRETLQRDDICNPSPGAPWLEALSPQNGISEEMASILDLQNLLEGNRHHMPR